MQKYLTTYLIIKQLLWDKLTFLIYAIKLLDFELKPENLYKSFFSWDVLDLSLEKFEAHIFDFRS